MEGIWPASDGVLFAEAPDDRVLVWSRRLRASPRCVEGRTDDNGCPGCRRGVRSSRLLALVVAVGGFSSESASLTSGRRRGPETRGCVRGSRLLQKSIGGVRCQSLAG